ncbi:MAG: polyphosphate kinase 1 [Acidimicrobiales bacterium]|nr:polyphosphate kinase 1 [Acidimicrobiales bacterium]
MASGPETPNDLNPPLLRDAPVGRASTAMVSAGGTDQREPGYLNRELSWLAFNERVLVLAEQASTPPLDRAKFAAIFSSNLDEFFQVRVAGLKDLEAAGIIAPSPDGRTPTEQLGEVRAEVRRLVSRQNDLYRTRLRPVLADHGVQILDWFDLSQEEIDEATLQFERRIFPILTPLAVDPGHPFPYISDLSLNLAVVLRNPDDDRRLFARVKVPNSLPRFIDLGGESRLLPIEQLIVANLGGLFPGLDILEHAVFRVTRNGDLIFEEEAADDLLAAVEMELRRRRFGGAIRLEVESTMSTEIREMLVRELELDAEDVYTTHSLVDLGDLMELLSIDRPDLVEAPWSGVIEPELATDDDERIDMFERIRRGELLLHHPYTSFGSTVVEFLRQASVDPQVVAIKITLYRTSGDSPIIDALIRASEAGIQVAVLIELKARFDEQANIDWAKRLEQAGVHVAYGLVGLKIHAKTCMVVRDEPDGIRRYCHVGTGNYNEKTARLYEDFGLLTSEHDVGEDISYLFNRLTGYGRDIDYERMVIAPVGLRRRLTHLIQNEAARSQGRIIMKMNSLVDQRIIDELYAASGQGVQIDLLVRGICCLRPGVPGQSENIQVRSVVGRYLEHSRVYYFENGNGPGEPAVFIGSADLMPRNLDRRVEALVELRHPDHVNRVHHLLTTTFNDTTLGWKLDNQGRWHRGAEPARPDLHERLQKMAADRAGRR